MARQASKRPQPSYVDGDLRDPKVKDLQAKANPSFSTDDMKKLVRKAAKKRPNAST